MRTLPHLFSILPLLLGKFIFEKISSSLKAQGPWSQQSLALAHVESEAPKNHPQFHWASRSSGRTAAAVQVRPGERPRSFFLGVDFVFLAATSKSQFIAWAHCPTYSWKHIRIWSRP
jgi:hypothetical protein